MTRLVNKAFKFRAYPTKEQQILINKTFGCSRFVYNYYLAKSIEDYKSFGKSNSCFQNCNDSTKLKNELGWEPSLQFEEGIEKTVKWYLDNQEWLDQVTSGDYQGYYERMYGNR